MTKPAEIRALAGARAFPPLVLVMFHFSEGHGYRNFWPLDLLAARGYLWVEFFFCLSGFILAHVYGPRLTQIFTRDGYVQFLKARLARLYPLHLFMLLAVLAVLIVTRILAHIGGYHSIFDLRYHQDVSVKGFFLSLFLVQGWNTMDRLTWNGVSWFVSVEWALCLMFPLLLRLANGRTWRGFLLIAAGSPRSTLPPGRMWGWTSPITMACCAAWRISPSAWALPCCIDRGSRATACPIGSIP
jgi:peptidoglycan/LPS O-acetylase OafA/YrhL